MAIGPGGPPGEIELDVGDPTPRPQYQDRHLLLAQELVRGGLAFALFLLLAGTVAWALNQAGDTTSWTNAKEALQILLPAETTLLTAAGAFYYRSRQD